MRPQFALSLAFLAAALGGCRHAPQSRGDVVWPLPPEKPRIRFVSSFAGSTELDTSRGAAFRRWLFGQRDPVLKQPMGLALSDDGKRLYIADYLLDQVVVADFTTHRTRNLAPDEPLGHVFGVALDASENVYVCDAQNHEVRIFSRAGKPLGAIGTKDLERPGGLALDRTHGLLYVVDSGHQSSERHRVLVYNLAGKYLRELGPKGGKPGRGPGDGNFHFPTFITLDREGNVYVADTMNFRIQVFDTDGNFVRRFGEQGDAPNTFNKLKGLAFDGFGNLYAVDAGHGNVQVFNHDFQLLMDFGGVANRLEYFDIPGAIAIDPASNRIYVANELVPRINVYELFNTSAADSTTPVDAAPASPKK